MHIGSSFLGEGSMRGEDRQATGLFSYVRLEERVSKRKSAPCASKRRATWLPTNPVAPVTKAFIEVFAMWRLSSLV